MSEPTPQASTASTSGDLWAIEHGDGHHVPALNHATALRWAAMFGGTATLWTGTPEDHKVATDEALAWADRFIEQHVVTD